MPIPPSSPYIPGQVLGSQDANNFGSFYGCQASLTTAAMTLPTTAAAVPMTAIYDPFGMITGSGTTSFVVTILTAGIYRLSVSLTLSNATVTTAGYAQLYVSPNATNLSALVYRGLGAGYGCSSQQGIFNLNAGVTLTPVAMYATIAPTPTAYNGTNYTSFGVEYLGAAS